MKWNIYEFLVGTFFTILRFVAHSGNQPFTGMPKEGKWIRIVLDLDGTLVYFSPKGKPDFHVQNIPYSFAPFALEFLYSLVKLPKTKISFFSAGNHSRNQEIISYLQRKVFLRTWKWIKFELLSSDHVSFGLDCRGDIGLKDLQKFGTKIGLESIILVDDNLVSYPGQEQNLLRILPGIGSQNANSRVTSNLIYAHTLIYTARQVSLEEGISLVEALDRQKELIRIDDDSTLQVEFINTKSTKILYS
jgi:hypothetical protein